MVAEAALAGTLTGLLAEPVTQSSTAQLAASMSESVRVAVEQGYPLALGGWSGPAVTVFVGALPTVVVAGFGVACAALLGLALVELRRHPAGGAPLAWFGWILGFGSALSAALIAVVTGGPFLGAGASVLILGAGAVALARTPPDPERPARPGRPRGPRGRPARRRLARPGKPGVPRATRVCGRGPTPRHARRAVLVFVFS